MPHLDPAPGPLQSPLHRWRRAIVWSAVVLAVVLGLVAISGPVQRLLIAALARVRPQAVLVTLPGQAVAILLCVLAQQALRPGVGFAASLAARLVRDAANNLPLMPPGPGDAIGARVLVLAGGERRAAISVRALDVLAELIAQLPYIALACVLLARLWHRIALPVPGVAELVGAAVPVVAAAGAALWVRGKSAAAQRLRGEARLLAGELARRRRAMPLAIALHFAAWAVSGVQIWLAARVLGLPLSLFGGIALESAASAARVILFVIPGGLVMQEAGIVGAGLVFGLPPTASLALALVLRLRDIVFGAAVLLWPAMEWRARRG